MSHAATNWAIRQRGLKPATKIVLWYLADCHNAHTGQCNPKQSTLAAECEMSRSTVNLHLDKLQSLGLIQRIQNVDKVTQKKRPTHYILALDGAQEPVSENRTRTQDVAVPCPKTGQGTVSENEQKPCPKNEHSRVRISDIKNLGKEPGKEPSYPNPSCGRASWGMEDLVSEISKMKLPTDTAPAFHMALADALKASGFDCENEFAVDDRGDGRRGKIDIMVRRDGEPFCGIECDRAAPRDKSARKLKEVPHGIIALREGSGARAEFCGFSVLHLGSETSSPRTDHKSGFQAAAESLERLKAKGRI